MMSGAESPVVAPPQDPSSHPGDGQVFDHAYPFSLLTLSTAGAEV